MGDETFDVQILTDKLLKLNSSQQSIQSLSSWCISFRKKAKEIVETWDNLFKSAEKQQRVSFLYLANDILQNSRRSGTEFVNEFWRVMRNALEHMFENDDESGKKAAARLVGIWVERKVFGSKRSKILGNDFLGKTPDPVKVLKKDANSLKTNWAVGDTCEKILTAFQLVLDESVNEDASINMCNNAFSCLGEIANDMLNSSSQEDKSQFVDKIREIGNILTQNVSKLEHVEASKIALICHLKEAVQDQESKLKVLQSDMKIERVGALVGMLSRSTTETVEQNSSSAQTTSVGTSFAPSQDKQSIKAAAAALAAKLAASTSSAQMLTSVLSILINEEAALKSGGLDASSSFKRLKLDSETTSYDRGMYFSPLMNQAAYSSVPQPPILPANSSAAHQLNPYVGPTNVGFLATLVPSPQVPMSVPPPQQQPDNGGPYSYWPFEFEFYRESHQFPSLASTPTLSPAIPPQ